MKILLQIYNWFLYSKEADKITEETVFGFTLSGLFSLIVPELIHAIAVIITGVLGTIAIHLTRRWINKRFPN